MELDEIIYNAIKASEAVSTETAGRIYSTCIEVPPTEDDNTPLPYIVITDGGYTNELGTPSLTTLNRQSESQFIANAHSLVLENTYIMSQRVGHT